MITKLTLRNFMAFDDLGIDFSPRVNVIIGENGTGKTQLMKVAYAALKSTAKPIGEINEADFFENNLLKLFKPLKNSLDGLCKKNTDKEKSELLTVIDAQFHMGSIHFERVSGKGGDFGIPIPINPDSMKHSPVFIPTKEVLTLFESIRIEGLDEDIVEKLFDLTYADLISHLEKDSFQEEEIFKGNPFFGKAYMSIAEKIGGSYRIIEDNIIIFAAGKFYIEGKSYNAKDASFYSDVPAAPIFVPDDPNFYSVTMSAEGYRKLGNLQRLLGNGSLSIDGDKRPVLFWDEPEANLNPALMQKVVEILLELSRSGVQIIISTHNYILLKWFHLLIDEDKDDDIKYHSLYRNEESGEIEINSCENYLDIQENMIAEAFGEIIDYELAKKMKAMNKKAEEQDNGS